MALIEIEPPSRRALRLFGLMIAILCGIIGAIVLSQGGPQKVANIIWAVGVVFAIIFYAIPPLRLILYYGWMKAVYPIGWTISHLVLLTTYYLILTPTGLLMRFVGRDPMNRKMQPDAKTYWTERRTGHNPSRYFNQY